MITNHLLEDKYRVQRELAKEAEYDVHRYMENVSRIVSETEQEYGVRFKYYSVNDLEDENPQSESGLAATARGASPRQPL